jgi:hypothetical protein
MKNVLITTQHRGVWFAQVDEAQDLTPRTLTNLKNTRMAIYWNTTRGLQELCEDGPNDGTKMSAISPIEVLHDITAVFSVSDKAAAKWLSI